MWPNSCTLTSLSTLQQMASTDQQAVTLTFRINWPTNRCDMAYSQMISILIVFSFLQGCVASVRYIFLTVETQNKTESTACTHILGCTSVDSACSGTYCLRLILYAAVLQQTLRLNQNVRNFCAAEWISVLGKQILYWGIKSCTQESVPAPRNQFLYWRIHFCTAESISVLGKQLLYWGINFCTGKSISVLGDQFLYWGLNSATPNRSKRETIVFFFFFVARRTANLRNQAAQPCRGIGARGDW